MTMNQCLLALERQEALEDNDWLDALLSDFIELVKEKDDVSIETQYEGLR